MARPIFLLITGALMLLSSCQWAPGQAADVRSTQIAAQVQIPAPPVRQFQAAPEEPSCSGSGCHEDPALLNPVSQHAPFANRQCSFCHGADPHNVKIALSSADSVAVCFACHSAAALGDSHRMGMGMLDPRSGEPITCTTCHSPHYSGHTFQLRFAAEGELCLQCHSELPLGSAPGL
ncbi:MAG: cytochrome c3 family protein [Bacteroidota bacterium]